MITSAADILCTVTVNLETSISKLGRVLFHNNSYVRCPLCFTKSSALIKSGAKAHFLEGKNVLFGIVSQFNTNKT